MMKNSGVDGGAEGWWEGLRGEEGGETSVWMQN